jgi:mRNA interferase HigB
VHIVTTLEGAGRNLQGRGRRHQAWQAIAKGAHWRKLEDVRRIFKDADPLGDHVILNIRHNRYRLITVVHYVKT